MYVCLDFERIFMIQIQLDYSEICIYLVLLMMSLKFLHHLLTIISLNLDDS